MKLQFFMKVALVVVLSACSWFCTSKLIAQGKRGHAASGLANTPASAATKKTKAADNVNPRGFPVKSNGGFQFGEMTVTTDLGRVTVNANVTIEEWRKGTSYMWSILIKDNETKKLVSCTNYNDQTFSVIPGVVHKPTFKDVFNLPPGTYNVELRLYEATPGVDLSVLRHSAVFNPQVLLANNKDVEILP